MRPRLGALLSAAIFILSLQPVRSQDLNNDPKFQELKRTDREILETFKKIFDDERTGKDTTQLLNKVQTLSARKNGIDQAIRKEHQRAGK